MIIEVEVWAAITLIELPLLLLMHMQDSIKSAPRKTVDKQTKHKISKDKRQNKGSRPASPFGSHKLLG